MSNITSVRVNGHEIGAVAPTPRGTFEGFLLTPDGAGYVPIEPRNNPEFSLEAHAADAVISEYNRARR